MKKNIIYPLLVLFFTLSASIMGQKYYAKHYKFSNMLIEAAKIPAESWFEKYKAVTIKDKYKVAFITNDFAEYGYAEYFKFAAERLGWEVLLCDKQVANCESEILKLDPDFMLFSHMSFALTYKTRALKAKKYTLSLSPINMHTEEYDGKMRYFSTQLVNELRFNTDAVISSAREIDIFQAMFKRQQREFNGFHILPLVPKTSYLPFEAKSLIWYGYGWDSSRTSGEYKKFINLLSQNIPIKIYGFQRNAIGLPNNVYDGFIPSALDINSVIKKNGIYLLTHSEQHLKNSTPSMRIFEAVAAGAIVISDMNSFAIENFRDNFLYFDKNADAETMYIQVKAHFDWILANPDKAKAMAERAHQIFLEKFTLEQDLIRIAKMHEYIIAKEKSLGLSFPVVYQ